MNRAQMLTLARIVLLLALMLFGTIGGAQAHRMTGRDIHATGVHHCTWSAAAACKRKTERRQIPCGNGRFCRW
jgi:hypothetical protein